MKLAELVKPWTKAIVADCEVNDLQNDSRAIQPGDAFIAYPGAQVDGRQYIMQARRQGAVAILYEPTQLNFELPLDIPCVPIPHVVEKLAAIASHFYDHPTRKLAVTGITGTNGKTTIAYQLAQAHQLLGQDAAYIGTLGQGPVHALSALNNTTPDGLCLQRLFRQYCDNQIKQVAMEVSSHALSLHRVDGIDFRQAIFTNLTRDHLDFHHSMENYAQAKGRLFAWPDLQQAILNLDDPYSTYMADQVKGDTSILYYSMQNPADVWVKSWQMSLLGTFMEVESPFGVHQIEIAALGRFNMYNALAIFTSLLVAGYPVDEVEAVMPRLRAAPGRLEVVGESPCVVVDYAHTPDALANALQTLQQVKKGKLWVIFGCGGDRDKGKRPVMGQVAQQYADQLVVTSDNPRSEDPEQIIDDIFQGIKAGKPAVRQIDRAMAIREAIESANREDIILIAGKGHEDYQQIGQVKYPFSDQAIAREVLCHLKPR